MGDDTGGTGVITGFGDIDKNATLHRRYNAVHCSTIELRVMDVHGSSARGGGVKPGGSGGKSGLILNVGRLRQPIIK